MNKIKIRDKKYNCSKMIYHHIKGLESKSSYLKMEVSSKDKVINDLLSRIAALEWEVERLENIINKIEEHFVFLKMNSTGGNKEFFEDILDFIKALKELKGVDKE